MTHRFQFGLASLMGLTAFMAVLTAIIPPSDYFQVILAVVYVLVVPLGGGLLIGAMLFRRQ